MTQTITDSRIRPARARRARRACTLIAAALFALAVWTISSPILGIDVAAGTGPTAQNIGPLAVAIVSIIAGGAAWALLALLEKAGTTGRRIWQTIGWLFLALSLIGPLTMATSAGALITLLTMHLVVGVTLLLGLVSTGRNA
ncbi:MAG TPA: DUF6069 family protein [Microbacteriaceae bacterium]|jgi:hypothetical protein|nr:DUF6069 family protein [Microbacteriaceae bacterium]